VFNSNLGAYLAWFSRQDHDTLRRHTDGQTDDEQQTGSVLHIRCPYGSSLICSSLAVKSGFGFTVLTEVSYISPACPPDTDGDIHGSVA